MAHEPTEQAIALSAFSATPKWAIAVAAVICLSHPFFVYVLCCGIAQYEGVGDTGTVCTLGVTLVLELIMLAFCWVMLFWFLFGKVFLLTEPGRLQVVRRLFGLNKRGSAIPITEQSYFRLMARTVMTSSLNTRAAATQQQWEHGVADNRFHSIMSLPRRELAWNLLCQLHQAYPNLPADENGTPISFTP